MQKKNVKDHTERHKKQHSQGFVELNSNVKEFLSKILDNYHNHP